MKKIAILTSGGDAPGMNAAIRAVVRTAIYMGMDIFGVERGYAGLIDNTMEQMTMRSVSDIIQRGGTILRTARCDEFKTNAGQDKAIANLRERGIEGLIVIGGDGSFMGAKILSEKGFPTVGIPGTIDNDLGYTEYTLGFDTACNTILDSINKIRDTMSSHERVSIIEVMGRHCGDLALYAGIGGGAEVIVVPEVEMSVEQIIDRMSISQKRGKRSGIIVMAEGAGKAEDLCKELTAKTTLSVRTTVIGHVQRGGGPNMRDRYLATNWGYNAVNLLSEGKGNRILGIRKGEFFDIDIIKGLEQKRVFNRKLYDIADIVSH